MLASLLVLVSCNEVDDSTLPAVAVNVDLSNQGIWNTYGVHGYGEFQYFILAEGIREPEGFPYNSFSATGYGGILLICGQGFSGDVEPLAYDLSCPVERLPYVRVYIDETTLDAVCPDCGSHYNVVEGNGGPRSGPAVTLQVALTPYSCYPTNLGGYYITR